MNDRRSNGANLYQQRRIAHWDTVARKMDTWKGMGVYYHKRITDIYKFLVSPGQKVLEIGCAQGDLLAALQPSEGVGVDFSGEMLKRAAQKYPDLQFVKADAHDPQKLGSKFDIIILSDLVNDLWDVQAVFEQLKNLATPRTRIIINTYSRLWEQPLRWAERLGLSQPKLQQNWLTVEDITNLLYLANMEVISHWEEILWPLPTPFLDTIINQFIVKIKPFNALALTNFIIARPITVINSNGPEPLVSVVIPARNEAGNIRQIVARVPEMGRGTELVFVEGHSNDNTYEAIESEIARIPEARWKLFRQTGKGKGDAVQFGFTKAEGEIFIILDADLTVPPEDLPRFYEALRSGRGEFVNGVRLVYPMDDNAMRFFNLVGNKFFSIVFSWLLGQSIKDTLCGTKALWKDDYEKLSKNRAYFGNFDPFGDFDLLFGAAKLNLKIIDLPIRYRERVYGTTNIERWTQGWLLLKMVIFAARRIKFI
jgi:ubiquinone/menaquinone biosynthesis C-methylase UbiE